MDINANIGISGPIGGALELGAASLGLITELQREANSPDEQKAAAAKQRLAELDAFVAAQKANNLEAERKEVEAVS
jgi:hypothetical protein